MGWYYPGSLVIFLGETALTAVGIRFVIIIIVAWIAYRLIFKKKYAIPEVSATK